MTAFMGKYSKKSGKVRNGFSSRSNDRLTPGDTFDNGAKGGKLTPGNTAALPLKKNSAVFARRKKAKKK